MASAEESLEAILAGCAEVFAEWAKQARAAAKQDIENNNPELEALMREQGLWEN